MKNLTLLTFLISIFIQPSLFAQSTPSVLPPQLLQQAKLISSKQQQTLSQQFEDSGNAQQNDYADNKISQEEINELTTAVETDEIDSSDNLDIDNRFGMSIFKNKVSTFSPADNLPVPDDYKLGAGDQLSIKLLGTENIQLNPTISRDGSIFINRIGNIVLSGLLFDDAVKLIKQRIESALIGVEVFVTMGQIKTINIFISGEVNKPGMYSLSALTSVTQSLYQAGGITRIGSLRNIQVLRNGELINVFDAYDLLVYGNSNNDIRLRSGDVLFVPTHKGVVTVTGNVKRTGSFEIKNSDTFTDLLKWTGGYSANANPEFGLLISSDEIGALPKSKTLDFNDLTNLAIELKPNDRFYIPAIGTTVFDTISILGAVNRPGKFGWFDGIRLSDLFSDKYEDFDQSAELKLGFIERFDPENFLWEIIPFSPIDIIERKSVKGDLTLNDRDIINILYADSRRMEQIESAVSKLINQSSDKQLPKVITISGAVKFPGEYPIFTDTSLAEMFTAAGGFKDNALLRSIEISRIKLDENGEVVPSVIEISALNDLNESRSFIPQSRDRVTVREIKELQANDRVNISGEVRYPGSYPITKGDTLKSIVERAGGLIDGAFPEGAVLQRITTMTAQKKGNARLADSIRSSYASSLITAENVSNTLNDINQVAETLENLVNDGRIVINLEAAIAGNKKNNIALEKDDSLFIPKILSTVSVIGEVNSLNAILFNPSLSIDDYIGLAGGFKTRADIENIFIIKANGSLIPLKKSLFGLGLKRYKVEQGDTIVVPVKVNYTDNLTLWNQVTQLIYQSLVSLSVLERAVD